MHGYGVCVALIVLALLAAAVSAGDGARIDVRSKRLSDVPISRLIFGNFIEAGFARQVPLMWAEMLYNRGFQEPVPYKSPMWDWIGFDPKHFNNKLPFWHSGYEEFDWELFGPTGTRKWRTLGTDTFKGNGSLVISVPDEGYGGIRQKGIYLHSGQTYDLAVFGRIGGDRNSDARRTVTVSLRWEGDAKPFFEKQVQFACFGEEHRLVVGPTAHAGRAVVEIGFAGKGELVLAWASMMPKETIHGWRPDVVKLLKRVAPPIIRFPGGCFASFSDWRQSVGPRAERQPIPSQYWGGLDDNDAGIDEFLDLCDEIGCEPQYCVNMMTSTPFKAAELVQYCNGPDDSAMGRYRVLNGVHRKRRVRYWEMDNETGRKWSATEYARKVVEFATEMRRVDPKIKVMMEFYSFGEEWLPKMLDIAGPSVDFVIHRDASPEFVHKVLPVLRAANKKHGRDIRLVNTEWLPDPSSPGPLSDPKMPPQFEWSAPGANDIGRCICAREGTWYYALNAAERLLDYLSYGGEFFLANFNNCVNTWGQNVIEASKEGAWLSPAGRVFELLVHGFQAEFPLQTSVSGAELLSAQACLDKGGKSLTVFVVNRGDQPLTLSLDLPDGFALVSGEVLTAPDRLSRTTLASDLVRRERIVIDGGKVQPPPLSVAVIRGALAK